MIIQWLTALWDWLTDKFKRGARPLKAIRVDELPDVIDKSKFYIVGEGEFTWCVAMLCPCGCGDTLQMNTLAGARPRWSCTEHKDGTVSLHPSVWRTVGCRSHFFLVHGNIDWCRRDDLPYSKLTKDTKR